MIIVKCERKGCKGHLVGFSAEGKPYALRNRSHEPTEIKVTKELRERIIRERYSEPFFTFMNVLEEITKDK